MIFKMNMQCLENNRNNRALAPRSRPPRGHKSTDCKPFSSHSLPERAYADCIKVDVLIDPPYNTGNDFVYEDDFTQRADEYLAGSGQFDDEGNRLVKNLETNGRFHTDWLNMIYPRLRLAKDLLTEDGVIFVQIDDNEVFNLRKICDEVFGAGNFLGVIVQNKQNAKNDTVNIQKNHEYIIVYRKNTLFDSSGTKILPTILSHTIKERDVFEESGKYFYLNDAITTRGEGGILSARPKLGYTVYYNPLTKDKIAVCDYDVSKVPTAQEYSDIYETREDLVADGYVAIRPPKVRGQLGAWTWSIEKFNEQIDEIVITGDPKSYVVRKRTFVPLDSIVSRDGKLIYVDTYSTNVRSIWDFSTNDGTVILNDVMGIRHTFSNAKNLELIKTIISLVFDKDSIILDFFSGSATTAHAVMQLNAEDGGRRKFIMVQIPEETDEKSEAYKAGYKNICEIGKERIRRAGAKIKEENPLTTQGLDIGFRVLKCDSSNMKDVYYNPADYDQAQIALFTDNIKEDRTPEDLLFQVMLDLGVPLSSKIEETDISGRKVFNVDDCFLLACFDEDVTDETVKEIAQRKPYYFVMRDSSLVNDSVAVNFEQIFQAYSPNTKRKVL